jgi:enterochelin esterase-like enzyme
MTFEEQPLKGTHRKASRFSAAAIFSISLLLALAGCAHLVEKNGTSLRLPEKQAVVIPAREIPPQIAALSGVWEGQWSDGRTSVLVVYRVENGFARAYFAFDEDAEYLPWHQWVRATIADDNRPRIEWKTEWAALSFQLSGDGKEPSGVLRELSDDGGKEEQRVVMSKRKARLISADEVPQPLVCPAVAKELRLIEREQDPSRRLALIDTIMERAKKTETPLIEPAKKAGQACAIFIYRGPGRDIAIAGHMNGWSEEKDYLSKLGDTDLFYFCGEYPADARIEYKLVVDGKAILDPLNTRVAVFGKGSNSEAPMPGYAPPKEIEPTPVGTGGSTEELIIDSSRPDMTRTATIYLPAGYDTSADRYPVLYLNDAFGALNFGKTTNVLDNLIRENAIPPLIAVFLPSGKDRRADYRMNPVFEAFFVEDVVPAIDKRYRTRPSPEFRAVGGISAGATAALSLALHHPDIFGKCMAQSTAGKLVPLINLARTGPNRPIRVYMDVGRFEADYYGTNLVDAAHRIRDALQGHGCVVHYREVNDGHGWNNWRARTREALTFLFGMPVSSISGEGPSLFDVAS